MYAYPSCFTDEMIDALADCDRVVKYIDMPLQHINDEILTRMRRRVTRAQTETLLAKLRKKVPGIALRTTFIAGSPGETESQHRELVMFVEDFGFDMMGVFPYSAEPGTAMGRLENQIPDEIKQQRVEELMLAQQKVAFAKAKSQVGQTVEVLIDAVGEPASDFGELSRAAGGTKIKCFTARTASQAPEIDSLTHVTGPDLYPGQFVNVKITDYQAYDLIAQVPQSKSRKLKVLAAST